MDYAAFYQNFRYAFNPRKPLLISRLALAVLGAKLRRKPRLRYVDFAVDFACNLNCEHCFASSLQDPKRAVLTLDDYARVAEEAMALGTVNFSYQGGEPLLFDKLDAVIAACQPSRNVISVTTNGTLLDDQSIRRLQKIGVDILTVSLDSSIPEEHDRFRGRRGVFKEAVDGISRALQLGMHVTIGTVITHETLHSPGFQGLLDMAAQWRVILYLIFPVSAGRWTGNTQVGLTREDLAYVNQMVSISPYIRTDFDANMGGYGCGAAKEILYITPYGDVFACPFMHIAGGNVQHESLVNIRKRMLDVHWFASYWPRCLVATDPTFINSCLSKTFENSRLPVAWRDVFPDTHRALPADGEGGSPSA